MVSTEALEVRPSAGGMLAPVASLENIIEAQGEVKRVVAKALKKGKDYGRVPCTDRDVLFKPGAERIAICFGARYEIVSIDAEVDHNFENEVVETKWDDRARRKVPVGSKKVRGLYRYTVRVKVITRDGTVLGDGLGVCSSLESKYCSRPHDVENTVVKMAKKRAVVDACLTAFGLSEMFTQDVLEEEDEPVPPPPTFASDDEVRAVIEKWVEAEPEDFAEAIKKATADLELSPKHKGLLAAAVRGLEVLNRQELPTQVWASDEAKLRGWNNVQTFCSALVEAENDVDQLLAQSGDGAE